MRTSRTRREVKPTPKWVVPAVIGAAIAVALAICLWAAVAAISNRSAEAKKLATFKIGIDAVLKLTEQVKPIATEYVEFKKAKPKDAWAARRLDAKIIAIEGLTLEDVVMLQGSTLLASISESPKGVKAFKEVSPDGRVEVSSGDYLGSGGAKVPCLLFRAGINVVTPGDRITVQLIVRRPD